MFQGIIKRNKTELSFTYYAQFVRRRKTTNDIKNTKSEALLMEGAKPILTAVYLPQSEEFLIFTPNVAKIPENCIAKVYKNTG